MEESKKPLVHVNVPLADTIQYEKNLSLAAKHTFKDLCSPREGTSWHALDDAECFAELVKANYICIEGFPASAPVPGSDRRSWWTKVEEFFGGGERHAR